MQKNGLTRNVFYVLFCLLVSILLIACGGNKLGSDDPTETEPKVSSAPSTTGIYSDKVLIDLTAEPEISIDPEFETTEVILQFIPRNEGNFPLTPEQVKVSLLLDDEEIDPEGHIRSSSQQLAFNVNFGLVLDSSYSMLVSHGDNEAFTPMLESAQNSVQKGIDIWSEQEGKFSFHTTWFNTAIYSSINTSIQQWAAEDITFIPQPQSGGFTRLFAATEYAIERMNEATADEELGPRDQNILLVFSDGQDNFSHYEKDKDDEPLRLTTENDAEYEKIGHAATDLTGLVETIGSQENLSIHVIGLGEKINVDDLQTIATAGNGLYLQNPGVEDIEKPFQRVIQEFTTLQTHGANIPLKAGEYKFTLRVENAAGSDFAEYSFRFKNEDGNVEIIPEA